MIGPAVEQVDTQLCIEVRIVEWIGRLEPLAASYRFQGSAASRLSITIGIAPACRNAQKSWNSDRLPGDVVRQVRTVGNNWRAAKVATFHSRSSAANSSSCSLPRRLSFFGVRRPGSKRNLLDSRYDCSHSTAIQRQAQFLASLPGRVAAGERIEHEVAGAGQKARKNSGSWIGKRRDAAGRLPPCSVPDNGRWRRCCRR